MKAFKFHRLLKSVLWGGERVTDFKGISNSQAQVGESWEISGVEGLESTVEGGDDEGLTLSQLIDRHREALVGEEVYARYGNRFPLLVKLIDAEQDLSIQVHPDDEMAMRRHGSNGKTEMWYVIDHRRGAKILAGFDRTLSPEEYDQRVENGTIIDVIKKHDAHCGDVFFLKAGCIHSIGGGNLVAEIQQTSDITYRVYDYDRRDSSGNLRELHVDAAREALNFSVDDARIHIDSRPGKTELVDCPYFKVNRIMLDGVDTVDMPKSFLIIMCLKGNVIVTDNNGAEVPMHRGETILVPACLTRLHLDGQAILLTASV